MKKLINIHPYDLELYVFTSARSFKMFCKKSNYLIHHGEDFSLDHIKGLANMYPDNTTTMLLPAKYDEEVLDHELIHITWYIAQIIGQGLTYDNNEFQTYLFGDLKKKIKKKVYKL